MSKICSLKEAIARIVKNGDSVAMEGFTHLIPYAAGHEVIRQQKRNLTLIRMTPDLIYDQLIGAGCVKKMIFSWGGNPGVGSLHRFRDAVENGWPQPLEIQEHSHADMASTYDAGAANLPFAVLRGHIGSDLPLYNPQIKWITCPFTDEKLAVMPALNPDVTIIHAQQADQQGNVFLWGIVGVQKQAVLAAEKVIITVEEIVVKLNPPPNGIVLPHWVIDAVCKVPGGAFPSYTQGYYERNNRFYQQWDPIARDRERFNQWIHDYVMAVENFADYKAQLEKDLIPGDTK
ncbi:MAG: CoA transferase subunit A [SAR324 cluster bacterium]|nr:CoA transferase subunit A [SAR324 cluster bacterium]